MNYITAYSCVLLNDNRSHTHNNGCMKEFKETKKT
jgi:hypothetical protein